LFESCGCGGVLRGAMPEAVAASAECRIAGYVEAVFYGDWDTVERVIRRGFLRLFCLLAGFFAKYFDEGIDGWIQLFNLLEMRVDQVDRRKFTGLDKARHLRERQAVRHESSIA